MTALAILTIIYTGLLKNLRCFRNFSLITFNFYVQLLTCRVMLFFNIRKCQNILRGV